MTRSLASTPTHLTAVMALVVFSLPAASRAQTPWTDSPEFGAWLGYNAIAADTELGNGFLRADVPMSSPALGIRGAANLGRLIGLEAEFKMTPSALQSGTTALIMGLRGGALAHFGMFMQERLRPFVWLGAGTETLQIESRGDLGQPGHVEKDTDFALHVGVGTKYRVLDKWLARLDVRYVNTASRVPNETTHNFEISLGASLLVGSPKKAGAASPPAEEPENLDHDGDGVPDLADKCTEAEDRDGFQDDDGCPDPDNDGDGIPDTLDKCPNDPETRNGVDDEDGCPDERRKPLVVVTREEIAIGEKVYFALNDAQVDARSHALLDAVAGVMRTHVQLTRVHVQGHTDETGDAAANRALSQRRAQAVVEYLVKAGIARRRLTAKGIGPGQPVCTEVDGQGNRTDACRDRNRRVEFKIVEVDGKPIKASDTTVIEQRKVIDAK